jgi:hypothetical protein
MHTVHGSRRGVLYVYDGKMMGGNSAFAFIGTYQESDRGEVSVEISTLRHNEDPNFQPLFKTDKITLSLKGRQQGEQYFFEGGTTQLPGVVFNSVMTPISEVAAPPVVSVGKGGISNGLYSIHIRMLDGIDGGNTGVMVLHDGKIRGGDAFFDYIGAYSGANGRWKGELVNHEHSPSQGERPDFEHVAKSVGDQQAGRRAFALNQCIGEQRRRMHHTADAVRIETQHRFVNHEHSPSQGERPVFGGYEVGIGFSGTYTDEGAVAEATALAGKRSIRFSAVLKKLAEA